MLLSSLIDPELIKVKVKANTKEEVIEQLLAAMFKQYKFQLDQAAVLSAIQSREALGGTILPTGIAVPHARIDLFNDILIAMATIKPPLEHEGTQIRVMTLILTSKTTSNLYLNCLASFARLSQNQEVFEKIYNAQSPQELAGIIQQANIEIKKELTVEHIMTEEIRSARPTMTVAQVIDLFIDHNTSYIPVVDGSGNFLGELTVLDILRLGIPNYAQLIGNINFLKTFEPLEDLLDKEDSLLVQDLIEKSVHTFSRSTSIVEAVSTFTKSQRRHIPVLDGTKIIGVVSFMDILRKVLRA